MQWRLLKDVPGEQVRLLLSVARRRRFARGEVVFHHGDPGDSLHLISSGHFAVKVMTPVGDTVMVAVLGPAENFGEMALVGAEARRSATVQALDSAETFAVYQADFHALRRQHPEVDRVLIAFLVGAVRTLNERLLEALYVPAERRILRRLVEPLPSIRATSCRSRRRSSPPRRALRGRLSTACFVRRNAAARSSCGAARLSSSTGMRSSNARSKQVRRAADSPSVAAANDSRTSCSYLHPVVIAYGESRRKGATK